MIPFRSFKTSVDERDSLPFFQKEFVIQTPQRIIDFLVDSLALDPLKAGRLIDKKRVVSEQGPITSKNQYYQGKVTITLFEAAGDILSPFFEHEDFALFEKPSGLLVHPKKLDAQSSLLDTLHTLYGEFSNIVHRLDKETSGLVLASRTKEAERLFKEMFRSQQIKKTYHALVRGEVTSQLRIDAPLITSDPHSLIRLACRVDPLGLPSTTLVTPLAYDAEKNQTLVEVHPLTGRQHQIRVHMFHVNHPLIGDPLYGVEGEFAIAYLEGRVTPQRRYEATGGERLMLHATQMHFSYKGEDYHFTSKAPFGVLAP